MKILHILDHSLPLHSGYTFRSQNIFRAQQKMGYGPVVLTSPKHEESLKGQAVFSEQINNIRYYRTGPLKTSRLPLVSELTLMHVLYHRILEIASVEKPDIIHAHSPVLNAIPAIKAARKLGLPVVYEIRAFWEDAAVDHGTYRENSWKYRLTKFIETKVCKRSDHIAILCNGLKNDLINRGLPEEKITPVFNGINPEDFRQVSPDSEYLEKWNLENRKIIGFIGSFYRYEGLDLLVKAFAKIADRYPDLMLLLVGGGEMKKELAQLASHSGISDRLVMPGRIPHERIAGIYAMIDILCYPRYSMRLTELVTPLKPLEAMAMGKALVASDVGGHRELIKDNETGLLFSSGNADALASRIENIMNSRELEKSLQTNGFEWVRKYHTWAFTTSVYKNIYQSLERI